MHKIEVAFRMKWPILQKKNSPLQSSDTQTPKRGKNQFQSHFRFLIFRSNHFFWSPEQILKRLNHIPLDIGKNDDDGNKKETIKETTRTNVDRQRKWK